MHIFLANKFAVEVIQPLVKQMDEHSQLQQSVIDGLFDQGVSSKLLFVIIIFNDLK